MKAEELLLAAIENGIIDLECVKQQIQMAERNKYLQQHKQKIYKGKDGAWYTYLPGRKLIRRVDKHKLEEAVIFYYKSLDDNPTLQEIFNEWIERKLELNKIKPATATRYIVDFNRYYSEFGNKRIKDISSEEFTEFLEEQIPQFSLTSKAFSNLRTITRGMLKRARKRKLIDFNVEMIFEDLDISEKDFKPRVVNDELEIFYDDEYTAIMKYCKEHSDDCKCLGIALMLSSGIRVGELVALKHNDISNGVIAIHRTETRYEKDGHWYHDVLDYPKTPAGVRRVIMPDSCLWILDKLKSLNPGEEYLFISSRGTRLHTADVRKRQYMVCRKLGIPVRSPHKDRKTYGSILLDNNVDTKFIEKQMGHTNIACTETHYHRDRRRDGEKRDILNKIYSDLFIEEAQ